MVWMEGWVLSESKRVFAVILLEVNDPDLCTGSFKISHNVGM